jgi:hypothetical protein
MNTKHCFAATIIVVAAMVTNGCARGKSSASNAASYSLAAAIDTVVAADKTDTLRYDTVSCEVKTSQIESSIKLDYPTADTPLAAAVRKYINQNLADECLPYTQAEEEARKRVQFTGSLADPNEVMKFYVKKNAEWQKSCRDEYAEGQNTPCYYELTMRKSRETDKYITYHTTIETYFGGAHGSFDSYCGIISKLTNEELKHTIDPAKVKQLQPLIRKGVISYFHECGETDVNDANLFEHLLLDEGVNEIPLPAYVPVFTDEGVSFTYQQYEIAPYCVGLVSFTIPFSKVKPYLLPEAKELLD